VVVVESAWLEALVVEEMSPETLLGSVQLSVMDNLGREMRGGGLPVCCGAPPPNSSLSVSPC